MGLQRVCDKCKEVIPVGTIYFLMELEAKFDKPNVGGQLVVQIASIYCNVCIRNGMAFSELLESYDQWEQTADKAESGRIKITP